MEIWVKDVHHAAFLQLAVRVEILNLAASERKKTELVSYDEVFLYLLHVVYKRPTSALRRLCDVR